MTQPTRHDPLHLRDRRRRQLARQGAHLRLDRHAARAARPAGPAPEVRPLHQRRSRDDEPLPARRGLRARRRRRDRPRPRPLRAVHRRHTTADCNYTTGKIYLSVIQKERAATTSAETVQVIPHVTDEIKDAHPAARRADDVDVVITEIGGTVGDIEGLPFLEAIRQFALDVGRENCLYIHLTLVPYLKAAGELKTKPTQHSVGELRRSASSRTSSSAAPSAASRPGHARRSPCSATSVEGDRGARQRDSIYEVPLGLPGARARRHRGQALRLGRARRSTSTTGARCVGPRDHAPEHEVTIAVVGKYMKLATPTSRSTSRSTTPASPTAAAVVIDGSRPRSRSRARRRSGSPASTASSSPAASASAASRARSRRSATPASTASRYFGICLGMQSPSSSSPGTSPGWTTRTAPSSTRRRPHPVICLMDEQKEVAGQRRHDAAGRRSRQAPRRARARASSTARPRQRAAPPPLRVQQPTAQAARGGRAWSRPAPRPTGGSSRSSSSGPPVVRGRRSSTPSSSRSRAPAPAVPRLRRRGARSERARGRRCRGALVRSAPRGAGACSLRRHLRRLCRIASPSGHERACADCGDRASSRRLG